MQDSNFTVYVIMEDQPGMGPYELITCIIAIYDNLKAAEEHIESYNKVNKSDNTRDYEEWDVESK